MKSHRPHHHKLTDRELLQVLRAERPIHPYRRANLVLATLILLNVLAWLAGR